MNIIFEKSFDNIIVCGDIHSDIMPLVFKINEENKIINSLIIVAGDVGLGFHKDNFYLDVFQKAAERLKKNNNTLLFVRGNHDNPDFWTNPVFAEYFQEGTSNIRLIRDYTTIIAWTESRGQYKILCVGGALSIDRVARTAGSNYWPNEPFVYDEEKASELEGITHVITHSCPHFCEPLTKGGITEWMGMDKELEVDCTKERDDHTLLYNKLKEKNQISRWTYGHYHYSHVTVIDETVFRMLAIMELCEI